ncbi:class V aminotransferase [Candidatus Scalindua japonica]|uniref:Cysteine desulfurase n=1 Tax=Candidatus Scalindua japonica TaxID=1284222 RepID=A0A286U053_9BACT|nr:cysteine desulfurase NifS [Candidatus Scalindua japonica]GAX61441.1 class V aminotransferase [Candidatus Scalindua japonica]
MKLVYADNNATTRVDDEVLEEMLPYFKEYYGNPSSIHTFGRQVAGKMDQARERVATILGADTSEIVFTSCGTESNNYAIHCSLEAHPDKKHVITTKVEHPAVLNVCKYFGKNGYEVTELDVDKGGMLDLDELRDSIKDNTAIVSIMHANNETGVIFPIEEIGKIVKEKGALFHCDAVQAIGKIPINLKHSYIDLLSMSGHKLHAPKGVGVLFIRKGVRIDPLIIGGHQEDNRRSGTENVPYIIGLGKACELAEGYVKAEQTEVRCLRDKLEKGIKDQLTHVVINGENSDRLPNTSSVSFEYVEGEATLLLLDMAGIATSSGSACTTGSAEPSHVLQAMGVPPVTSRGTIRFSLSKYNTEEDVDYILEKLVPIIKRLQSLSPLFEDSQ